MDHLQNVMGYFRPAASLCAEHDRISKDLYKEFGVKAGLRDENGKGVLAGLTNISDIRAFQYVDGGKKLYTASMGKMPASWMLWRSTLAVSKSAALGS